MANNQTTLELVQWAREVAEKRHLDFAKILEAIEEGLAISVRRKYDSDRAFRIKLDPKTGEATIYRLWKVVEDVNVSTREISLEAALYENPNIKVGDYIEDIDEDEEIVLDRIGYNTFRQIMTAKVRSLENEKIIKSYEPYLGTVVTGRVKQTKGNSVTLTFPELNNASPTANPELDEGEHRNVEGIIRKEGTIPGERLRNNQEVKALLLALESGDPNKQQMVLSRSAPEFLGALLTKQVPEIQTGQIEIVAIARDPGVRAKVIVKSHDQRLDVIGACLGVKTTRISPVSRELHHEKIDIIPYDDDFVTYIHNLLTLDPTQEAQIVIDDQSNQIQVAVNKEQLSSSIGQKGVNVRLASQILGWKIRVYDLESFEKAKNEEDQEYIKYFIENLNLDEDTSRFLVEQGFKRIEELALAELSELEELFETEDAQELQNLAKAKVAEILNAQKEKIAEANIDPRLQDLEGMNNDILLKLAENQVTTIEDLADLATDELTSYISMSDKVANSLIMQARQIVWFNEEETEA
ncbi:transcription termination factor NusA [Psittacicella hinzii]|uniref:Transcription termination/antitermination protein NusA n=1 Tax=Psittacicella hinzii TaxID=2028575 RepID=A0A3A1YBJ7_9GAMM|nr:transcription termination factor NusA [Psittacicella hinzii]RIY35055.1 transcription termination factor NusA [Psittacicella hinzii]